MINIENTDVFGQVIASCLKTVDDNRQIQTWEKLRCVNAIAKASARMQSPDYANFMDFDGETGTLLIWNTVSNAVYTVTETAACQCMAAQNGVICWHKAVRRLYELYIPLALKAAFDRNEVVEFNRSLFGWDDEVCVREVAA